MSPRRALPISPGLLQRGACPKLNCTVECSPLLGKQLMKAVKDYMAGKDLPIRMVTAEEVFPAEVARKVLPTRKY